MEFVVQLFRKVEIKYFDNALIEHLEDGYFEIGLLFGKKYSSALIKVIFV